MAESNEAKSASVSAIKDELALKLAREVMPSPGEWTAKQHMLLIWRFFRQAGFSPADIGKAGKEWEAFYSNAACGYASNQSKRMVASGIATDKSAATAAEWI